MALEAAFFSIDLPSAGQSYHFWWGVGRCWLEFGYMNHGVALDTSGKAGIVSVGTEGYSEFRRGLGTYSRVYERVVPSGSGG